MGYYKNLSQQGQRRFSAGGTPLKKDKQPFLITVESTNTNPDDDEQITLKEFRKRVNKWAEDTTILLRANFRGGTNDTKDSASTILPNVYIKGKQWDKVSFRMARHLVYVHKGAGKGQGGDIGSKWTDRYGKLKQTDPNSLGFQNTGKRIAFEWFDPMVKKQLGELADIVAEYNADMVMNATQIFIKR
jgi:hypothetical protein